jgi:hypothetical protein
MAIGIAVEQLLPRRRPPPRSLKYGAPREKLSPSSASLKGARAHLGSRDAYFQGGAKR